jgi:hypothetical protein
MAIEVGSDRRFVIARAATAQTAVELETALVAVERLLGEEPGDPTLESLLRGLDARFTRLTHDPIHDDEPGCLYHPERDPGFV